MMREEAPNGNSPQQDQGADSEGYNNCENDKRVIFKGCSLFCAGAATLITIAGFMLFSTYLDVSSKTWVEQQVILRRIDLAAHQECRANSMSGYIWRRVWNFENYGEGADLDSFLPSGASTSFDAVTFKQSSDCVKGTLPPYDYQDQRYEPVGTGKILSNWCDNDGAPPCMGSIWCEDTTDCDGEVLLTSGEDAQGDPTTAIVMICVCIPCAALFLWNYCRLGRTKAQADVSPENLT